MARTADGFTLHQADTFTLHQVDAGCGARQYVRALSSGKVTPSRPVAGPNLYVRVMNIIEDILPSRIASPTSQNTLQRLKNARLKSALD